MDTKHDFYQVSLKLILKNDNNEILSLGGLVGGSYEGYYDFPGGRINTDEFSTPLMDVLRREVVEEIGDIQYKVTPKPVAVGRHLLSAKIFDLPEDVHVLYLFFEAKYIGGEIKISKEHENYKWLNLDTINLDKLFMSANLEGIKMYLNK